jgi:two-component system, chemotaxis family, protein-glutamate methylesterase/glutaminase
MTATERQLDIVAIGASAGGVKAISSLLEQLPCDLPAAILVVLHRPPERVSLLQRILSEKCKLHVVVLQNGELLRQGTCFIGEPDLHLTVSPDLRVHLLADGFYRAHNIDALFCSLARHAGRRTIGIVLSGMLKDGVLGLKAIKEAGGVALVQSPEESEYSELPNNAIKFNGPIDLIAPVDVLAQEICRLVGYTPLPARMTA